MGEIMKKNNMKDVALLIAESPWWSPRENPGEASAYPFFEGIQKLLNKGNLKNHFNLYSANFYDNKSFEYAINHLIGTSELRQILYIGGHGDGKLVAEAPINQLTKTIKFNSNKIKGIIVSSCSGGKKDTVGEATWRLDNTGPNWVVAYRKPVLWFQSVLLEVSIIYNFAIEYMVKNLNSRKDIINVFEESLEPFDYDSQLGIDDTNNSIKDVMRIWIRAQGAEFEREATDEIFD